MVAEKKQVSWKTYAQKYDMLMLYNPYYLKLQKAVLDHTSKWVIAENETMLDLGAGTGNYSIPLAGKFPHAKIYHVDSDGGMNTEAVLKRDRIGLENHIIVQESVDQFELEPNSVAGLVSIHAIYTFPNPKEIMKKMYQWLKPGTQAILVDPGRIINVLSWQLAIGKYLIQNYGFRKTMEIMKEGKEVSKQNAKIREMQKSGEFWTHSHEEFCEAVREAGFEIITSYKTFRKVSDLIVVSKPK